MGITGITEGDSGSGSTIIFLFRTFGIRVQVTSDDLDLL